ncbi:hypothetical protein [Marinitoga lauensis]|uniref:hypothetical protein n=1 Tax=Marinitoga lauensis TaxID=2201189 RepID=UPI00197CC1EC|nr:hypothetical protein [Marinitoga lauensis]
MKGKKLSTFVKVILVVIIAVILYFPGVILLGTLTDYNPEKVINLQVEDNSETIAPLEITLFDWNIGYAGLGKDEDFFLDGGKTSVPEKSHVEKYMEDIANIIKKNSADIYLIQEIDLKSHRSYNLNELEYLRKNALKSYGVTYAINYNVLFVPVPFMNPMGR